MKTTITAILAIAMTCSCTVTKNEIATGADRDSHGCIASAGYTWSKVRQDCIRIFEDGISLNDAANPNATLSAFAVFSTDNKQAELFLPKHKSSIVLNQNNSHWTDKNYDLLRKNGKLILLKKNKEAYRE